MSWISNLTGEELDLRNNKYVINKGDKMISFLEGFASNFLNYCFPSAFDDCDASLWIRMYGYYLNNLRKFSFQSRWTPY